MTNITISPTRANLLPYRIELWFPVPGYTGLYEASTKGRVRSLIREVGHTYGRCTKQGTILMPSVNKKGYLMIKLYNETKTYNTGIHRIIALTFVANQNNYDQINHKKGIKTDNRPFMLEWCNCQMNIDHKHKFLFDKDKYRLKMQSPERVRKISESTKGAKNPYAKKVIDTATGEVFGCVGDAATKHGYTYNQLKQWLNGRRKNLSSLRYMAA